MIDESCIVLEPGFKRLNEMGPLDDDVAIVLASEMVKFAMQDLTMASRSFVTIHTWKRNAGSRSRSY